MSTVSSALLRNYQLSSSLGNHSVRVFIGINAIHELSGSPQGDYFVKVKEEPKRVQEHVFPIERTSGVYERVLSNDDIPKRVYFFPEFFRRDNMELVGLVLGWNNNEQASQVIQQLYKMARKGHISAMQGLLIVGEVKVEALNHLLKLKNDPIICEQVTQLIRSVAFDDITMQILKKSPIADKLVSLFREFGHPQFFAMFQLLQESSASARMYDTSWTA